VFYETAATQIIELFDKTTIARQARKQLSETKHLISRYLGVSRTGVRRCHRDASQKTHRREHHPPFMRSTAPTTYRDALLTFS
jgi:hypothetical protein